MGGITGPLLSSQLAGDTGPAFRTGAVLMTPAGLVAAFLALPAERRSLEYSATPLTATRGLAPQRAQYTRSGRAARRDRHPARVVPLAGQLTQAADFLDHSE